MGTKHFTLFFRSDEELRKRIFCYQEKLNEEMPMDVAFSAALRHLVEKALDAEGIEGEG